MSWPGSAKSEEDSREHLLAALRYRDVTESDECFVIEMDNRPDLANTRGALQGGWWRR
jgi:hypothetical protein